MAIEISLGPIFDRGRGIVFEDQETGNNIALLFSPGENPPFITHVLKREIALQIARLILDVYAVEPTKEVRVIE